MTNEHERNLMGQRVRQLYEGAGMTQREFASRVLHCSQTSVSQKCAGIVSFTSSDIVHIAQAFNLTTDYLYGLSDDEQRVAGGVVAV